MKKFTLMELILCIGCVLLLGSIGISAVRAGGSIQGEETVCADQQRKIFAALSQYAADNAGYYPYFDDEHSIPGCKTRVTWAYRISKYLPQDSGNKNYFCPAQQAAYPLTSRSNINSATNCVARPDRNLEFYRSINYGINFEYIASNIGTWAGKDRKQYITMNTAKVVNPAEKVLTADAWNGKEGRYIIASYSSGSNKMNPCHANGTNVLWCDGHVAKVNDPHAALQNGKLVRKHFRADQ